MRDGLIVVEYKCVNVSDRYDSQMNLNFKRERKRERGDCVIGCNMIDLPYYYCITGILF